MGYPYQQNYPFNTPQGGYQPQNNYQQYGNVPVYQQQQTPQMQVMNPALATVNQGPVQDERIWVQSAAAAEAYPLRPNEFVRLWHSTQPIYFEKSADAAGRPLPMIPYEYKVLDTVTEQQGQTAEIPDYEAKIKALEERLEALETKASNTTNNNNNGSNKKEAK